MKAMCYFGCVIVVLASGPALAQDRPDLAGTWMLHGGIQGTSSLSPVPAVSVTVVQDESVIRIGEQGAKSPTQLLPGRNAKRGDLHDEAWANVDGRI